MEKLLLYPALFTLGFLALPLKERFVLDKPAERVVTIPQEIVIEPSLVEPQVLPKVSLSRDTAIKTETIPVILEKRDNVLKSNEENPFIDNKKEPVADSGFNKFRVKTKAKYFRFEANELEQEKIIEEAKQIISESSQKRLPSQIPNIASAMTSHDTIDYSTRLISLPESAFEDSTITVARLIYKVDSQNFLAHLSPDKSQSDSINIAQSSSAKNNSSEELVFFDYSNPHQGDKLPENSHKKSSKAELVSVDEVVRQHKEIAPIEPVRLSTSEAASLEQGFVAKKSLMKEQDLLKAQDYIKLNFLNKEELQQKTGNSKADNQEAKTVNQSPILTTQNSASKKDLIKPEIWNLLHSKKKSSSSAEKINQLMVNNSATNSASNSKNNLPNKQSGFVDEPGKSGKDGFFDVTKAKTNSETTITARAIGLKKNQKLKTYDVSFLDDLDEYKSSDLSGKITLATSVVNSHGTRRLKFSAKGVWPTQVDISIDEGSFAYDDVVLLQQDFIDSLKLYEQHQDHRAIALFRLNEDIEDIEIEGSEKLYLNKNLKTVNPSAASYLLFKGLTPGNTIVNFILSIGDRETSKIVYIPESELYYDDPLIRITDKSKFDIKEIYLTAKKGRPLSFAPKLFENFFYDSKMKKIGLNKYSEGRTYLPLGTRNYYAINFKDEKIYFGTGNKTSISLPGLEFSDFVMDALRLSDPMKYECLVQLNFSKQIEKVTYETYGEYGSTMGEIKYRNSRGDFLSQVEDEIENAYLISKEQGVFFVKVKYLDQSFDYLQTFCSTGSYLVEQL